MRVAEAVRVKVMKRRVQVGYGLAVALAVCDGSAVAGGRKVAVRAGRVGVLKPGVRYVNEKGVRISWLTGSMMPAPVKAAIVPSGLSSEAMSACTFQLGSMRSAYRPAQYINSMPNKISARMNNQSRR